MKNFEYPAIEASVNELKEAIDLAIEIATTADVPLKLMVAALREAATLLEMDGE
jgi:hypothetical protein